MNKITGLRKFLFAVLMLFLISRIYYCDVDTPLQTFWTSSILFFHAVYIIYVWTLCCLPLLVAGDDSSTAISWFRVERSRYSRQWSRTSRTTWVSESRFVPTPLVFWEWASPPMRIAYRSPMWIVIHSVWVRAGDMPCWPVIVAIGCEHLLQLLYDRPRFVQLIGISFTELIQLETLGS